MVSETVCLVALLLMYFTKIQSMTLGGYGHKHTPSPNINKKFKIYCTFGKNSSSKDFYFMQISVPPPWIKDLGEE